MNAVDHLLVEGKVTVGYPFDIKHLATNSLSMQVTAKAELVSMEGRMLRFRLEAYDEVEMIGEGNHIRALVNIERFKANLAIKSPG